jgi:hypothetical protein
MEPTRSESSTCRFTYRTVRVLMAIAVLVGGEQTSHA